MNYVYIKSLFASIPHFSYLLRDRIIMHKKNRMLSSYMLRSRTYSACFLRLSRVFDTFTSHLIHVSHVLFSSRTSFARLHLISHVFLLHALLLRIFFSSHTFLGALAARHSTLIFYDVPLHDLFILFLASSSSLAFYPTDFTRWIKASSIQVSLTQAFWIKVSLINLSSSHLSTYLLSIHLSLTHL